jgi:hypothetical protein
VGKQIRVDEAVLKDLENSLRKFSDRARETVDRAWQMIDATEIQIHEQEQLNHNSQEEIDYIVRLRKQMEFTRDEYEHLAFPFKQLLENEIPDAISWLQRKNESITHYIDSSSSANSSLHNWEADVDTQNAAENFSFVKPVASFWAKKILEIVLPVLPWNLGYLGIAINLLGLSVSMPAFQLDLGGISFSLQPEFKIPFFSPANDIMVDVGLNVHSNHEELDTVLSLVV